MQDKIGPSVLDAMRLLLRDRLNKEQVIIEGLHFYCEAWSSHISFRRSMIFLPMTSRNGP
jgi:hypothetical protein